MALRFPNIRNPFAQRENYEDAAKVVGSLVDPRPFVSDAYWSATHPRDRLLGRGRAANPMMAFPLGGRYSPRTPGLKAEIAESGDDMLGLHPSYGEFVDIEGFSKSGWSASELRQRPSGKEWPGMKAYNIRGKDNELLASLSGEILPRRLGHADREKEFLVHELVVEPEAKKTSAFMDLLNIASRGGTRKINPGMVIEPRLEALVRRRFDPERQKVLDAVEKAGRSRAARASAERRGLSEHTQWGGPVPKKRTQLDDDIRKLRLEVEASGLGSRQVTNRDIGHPLAPARVPTPRRPTRPAQLTPRQQQTQFLADLRQRRRGGR